MPTSDIVLLQVTCDNGTVTVLTNVTAVLAAKNAANTAPKAGCAKTAVDAELKDLGWKLKPAPHIMVTQFPLNGIL
jgi:hypothetical protein